MARSSKTGGGPGTNQYRVRGQAKVASNNKPPKEVYGYPADQVIKRGDCAWPRGVFDDPWCLKHRQLAPELRQLMGLPACATRLGPKLQQQLADSLPTSTLGAWASQMSDVEARCRLVKRAPIDQLGWATKDESWEVRRVAVVCWPIDQLDWATKDPDEWVRQVAARQMLPSRLEWAARDPDWQVRWHAAQRMPIDQLEWATQDSSWRVREAAAQRMPIDQLEWTTPDPAWRVREAAAKRLRAAKKRG